MARHLPRDDHHGDRVHLRRGDPSHKVSGSRARGAKADADLTCGSRIAIGGMGCTLLMANQNMLEVACGLTTIQLVVDRQNCATGVAKNMRDAMSSEAIHQRESPCGASWNDWSQSQFRDNRRLQRRRKDFTHTFRSTLFCIC